MRPRYTNKVGLCYTTNRHPSRSLDIRTPQVLAFDASNSPAGRGTSRHIFAETDRDDGGTARRFLALDYRGNLAGQDGGAQGGTTGWALGTGSDGNGALGVGRPAELAR